MNLLMSGTIPGIETIRSSLYNPLIPEKEGITISPETIEVLLIIGSGLIVALGVFFAIKYLKVK